MSRKFNRKTVLASQFFTALGTFTALICGGTNGASAASIGIVNPGFEAQALNNGDFIFGITGWNADSGSSGVFNPGSQFNPGFPTEGNNSAFVSPGSISQQLTATLAAGVYTLNVDVGDRLDFDAATYLVELLAGATVIAQDSGVVGDDGEFVTSTVTFTATDIDPLGQPLSIRLSNTTFTQTNFDNVQLEFVATSTDSTAIPTPALLPGLVGMGIATVRKHRYLSEKSA